MLFKINNLTTWEITEEMNKILHFNKSSWTENIYIYVYATFKNRYYISCRS